MAEPRGQGRAYSQWVYPYIVSFLQHNNEPEAVDIGTHYNFLVVMDELPGATLKDIPDPQCPIRAAADHIGRVWHFRESLDVVLMPFQLELYRLSFVVPAPQLIGVVDTSTCNNQAITLKCQHVPMVRVLFEAVSETL